MSFHLPWSETDKSTVYLLHLLHRQMGEIPYFSLGQVTRLYEGLIETKL